MLSYAWIAGISATLAAGWQQFKNLIERFARIFIVKYTMGRDMSLPIWSYLNKHARPSPFNDKRYYTESQYIKSYKDWHKVVFCGLCGNNTFWYKKRPLFITYDPGNYNLTFKYIRGTLNIEQFFIDAVEEFNKIEKEGTKNKGNFNSRFRVKKVFGSVLADDGGFSRKDRGELSKSETGSDQPVSNSNDSQYDRILKWGREDLGMPTPEKPFNGLSYGSEINEIRQEIVRWIKSKKWFNEKGLDWRMGAGLFGPAGTGKTSFARALGQEFDLPVHIFDLTTMTNKDLCDRWSDSISAAPLIILFEDFDRLFGPNKEFKPKNLTLDTLLNCIQGVEPSNGVLLLVTANHPELIDAAMGIPEKGTGKSTRPGRLDRCVWFGVLEEENRRAIAQRILSDYPQFIEEQVKEGAGETGAQFQKRCESLALKLYWGRIDDVPPPPIADDSLNYNKPLYYEEDEKEEEAYEEPKKHYKPISANWN